MILDDGEEVFEVEGGHYYCGVASVGREVDETLEA